VILFSHRINTVEELINTPQNYGIEIDLRDEGGELILAHDPFVKGERFLDFLKYYKHNGLILNIKSERIEWKVLELLDQHKVQNYFFLDSSFPMMVALAQKGITKQALRFSEYESLETILAFKGKAQWVWVDCFTQYPLTQKSYKVLKENGFKLCLVSPELQGRFDDVEPTQKWLKSEQFLLDGICSKQRFLQSWGQVFS